MPVKCQIADKTVSTVMNRALRACEENGLGTDEGNRFLHYCAFRLSLLLYPVDWSRIQEGFCLLEREVIQKREEFIKSTLANYVWEGF